MLHLNAVDHASVRQRPDSAQSVMLGKLMCFSMIPLQVNTDSLANQLNSGAGSKLIFLLVWLSYSEAILPTVCLLSIVKALRPAKFAFSQTNVSCPALLCPALPCPDLPCPCCTL